MTAPVATRTAARAAVLAATALALAVGAHLLGGGTAPGGLGLASLAALTLLVATVVARATSTPPVPGRADRQRRALLVTFGGLELSLHAGLTVLAGGHGAGHGTSTDRTSAALAHLDHLGAHGTAAAGTGVVAMHHHAGPGMLLAHLGATVLTVWLLSTCDKAADLCLRWWYHGGPVRLVVPALLVPAGSAPAPDLAVRPVGGARWSGPSRPRAP